MIKKRNSSKMKRILLCISSNIETYENFETLKEIISIPILNKERGCYFIDVGIELPYNVEMGQKNVP